MQPENSRPCPHTPILDKYNSNFREIKLEKFKQLQLTILNAMNQNLDQAHPLVMQQENWRPCPHGSFYSPKPYNTSLDLRLENILKSCTTSCWQSPHPTLNPSELFIESCAVPNFP